MNWLIKLLGVPIIKEALKFLYNILMEIIARKALSDYKKKELLKVKEAYELTQSKEQEKQMEGVKKFEEIFADFT